MKAIQKIKSNLSKIIKVLRHGILSLYSYIRKFVPWRSRTYIQNLHHVRIAGVASSFLFGLLALAIIIPLYNVSGTEDTEAAMIDPGEGDPSDPGDPSAPTTAPTTGTDSTLTFTATRTTVSANLTAGSTTGTFASSEAGVSDAAFSVYTNNSAGYELKIYSASDTSLMHNSNSLTPISTSGTQSVFTNNTWGYLPSTYRSGDSTIDNNSTVYFPITTSETTLDKVTTATTKAYTIGLGAKASISTPSGTYTNSGIIIAYVANPTNYAITYNAGPISGTPSDIPAAQTGYVSTNYVNLSSTTPSLTGWTFLGWCDGGIGESGIGVTCYKNYTYDPGSSFPIDRTRTNNITLTATWKLNTYSLSFDGSTPQVYYRYGINTYYSSPSYTSTITKINVPTRTGYTFGGYYTGTNGTGTQYIASDGSFVNDPYYLTGSPTTLYAKWTANTYSLAVTFAGSGVSSVQVRTSSGTAGTLKGTVSSSGGSVSGLTYNTTYYLYPVFSSGYEFSSWAKTSSTGTLSSTTTSNPTFRMGAGNGAVTITGKSSCTPQTTVSGTMQAFCPASSIANGTSGTLTDSRDNTSYKVAKLADGKWWMLDNLALDLVANKDTLSSSNTNATDTELGYLKGTSTGTTSNKYATAAIANWTSSYSYSAPLQSLTNKDRTVTSYGSGSGKVGGYYNYCAASAGTYCYGNGTSQGTSSGNATADICPYKWRMPTGGSSGEYNALYTNAAIGSDATNFRNALSTPLSGIFDSGSAGYQRSEGYFWSSTRKDNTYMYGLYVESSDVQPTNIGSRRLGRSVRCVLK